MITSHGAVACYLTEVIMSTRRNKTFAQAAQKATAQMQAEYFNLKCGGPLDDPIDCDIQARCMGIPGRDILKNSKKAMANLPFATEVKATTSKSNNIIEAFEQATTNCNKNEIPIVVYHYSNNVPGKHNKKLRLALISEELLYQLTKGVTND